MQGTPARSPSAAKELLSGGDQNKRKGRRPLTVFMTFMRPRRRGRGKEGGRRGAGDGSLVYARVISLGFRRRGGPHTPQRY